MYLSRQREQHLSRCTEAGEAGSYSENMRTGGRREKSGRDNPGGKIPKVSVALVTLNAAETVEETLQSVFAQTFELLEVVVVDGGSTDGTLDIIGGREDLDLYATMSPSG